MGDAGGTNVRFAHGACGWRARHGVRIWKRRGRGVSLVRSCARCLLSRGRSTRADRRGASALQASSRMTAWNSSIAAGRSISQRSGRGLAWKRMVAVNDFFAMARSAPELGRTRCDADRAGHARSAGRRSRSAVRARGSASALLRRSRQGWIVDRRGGRPSGLHPADRDRMETRRTPGASGLDTFERDVAAGMGFEKRAMPCRGDGPKAATLSQSDVIDAALGGATRSRSNSAACAPDTS